MFSTYEDGSVGFVRCPFCGVKFDEDTFKTPEDVRGLLNSHNCGRVSPDLRQAFIDYIDACLDDPDGKQTRTEILAERLVERINEECG
jgi:hypothetical protein